jgi:sarcosine oxidase
MDDESWSSDGEMRRFDAAVLGLGTMGSFTCLELARRGLRVAGFDQFAPPHDRGSHSGDTRVFRIAYAEHPDYVPLAQRAAVLWDQHGSDFGKTLLTQSGMLSAGPLDGELIAGIRASAKEHHLALEELSSGEIRNRYPAFVLPEDWVGILEPTAGWLDVNASIECALEAAGQRGAHLFTNAAVAGWRERAGRIVVETANETIEADRLVIAAGAWAGALLGDLRLPLSIRRKVLVWIDPKKPEHFAPGRFPVFAVADSFFYGFPNIAGHGVKVAIHLGQGRAVASPSMPTAPPGADDLEPIVQMASQYLPGLASGVADGLSRVRRAVTCFYTMTPDEHFILDRHPSIENVWFAAGFSGHGFKFAPVIAEALADLCVNETTAAPVDFLRIGRRFESGQPMANPTGSG